MKQILLTILNTLLVSALVVSVCFLLVAFGRWKSRKPVVKADSDGRIVLKAIDAEIVGMGTARYNVYKGVKNIGWWDDISQSLRWRFIPEKNGVYEVHLKYALPSGLKTEFVLSVFEQELNGVIAATGGWDKWHEASLGRLNLSAGNVCLATIRPIKTTTGRAVMNFCELELKPVLSSPEEGGNSDDLR